MQPERKINPGLAALIVIILVGIAATAVIVINTNQSDDTTAPTTSESTTTEDAPTTTPSETATGDYKDGTYSATGSYSSPGGRESIELTVTIKDGVITSTSMVANARSGEAEEYQADFAAGYKSLVVGKNVDEVSLSRVAGSSLTSNGFNDALDQIKSDAEA